MVMSVNQLSLHGAIADMFQGFPEDQVAPGRPVASDQTEQEILVHPPIARVPSNDERQGNLLQDYEQRFESPEAGLRLVEVGQFFYPLPSPKEPKIECAQLRENEDNCAKGWIRSNARFGPVLEVKVCKTMGGKSIEVKIPHLFEDDTTSWIKIVSGVEKCQRSNADRRRRRSFGETRCKG